MTGPTFKGELRRGVNAFNLSVGLATSLAAATLSYFQFPDLWALGPTLQAALVGILTMFLTTGLHTAGHAYFGWRFEQGVRAHSEGRFPDAVRLLAVVEKKEMDHFDPDGVALDALRSSRRALQPST